MKKQILSVVLLTFVGSLAANAQNVKQMVKSKADSAKNATVTNVINNPVGSVKSLVGLFHHAKPPVAGSSAPAVAAAPGSAGTVASNVVTAAPAAAPANTSSPASAPVGNNAGLITNNAKNINNGLVFSIVQCTGDKASQTITITYTISNPSKANQKVLVGSLNAYSDDNPGSAIDDNGNKLAIGSITLGNNTAARVLSELPTGIKIKGSLTLINALSTSSNLQYFKIPVASANEQGNGDRQGTVVEERNIPVVWVN